MCVTKRKNKQNFSVIIIIIINVFNIVYFICYTRLPDRCTLVINAGEYGQMIMIFPMFESTRVRIFEN